MFICINYIRAVKEFEMHRSKNTSKTQNKLVFTRHN